MHVRTYADFAETRQELLRTVDAAAALIPELEISDATAAGLSRVRHVITTDAFRVLVAGSFSRGKSTVINAMLGADLLPARLAPTTATIVRIKYGTHCIAHAIPKGGGPPELVPIDRLKEHLSIPRGELASDTYDGSPLSTRYDAVEIEYPCRLCENGVELVDSPGLEEDNTRQKITLDYLSQSDAAVVVLSSQQLLTVEEERFIQAEIQARGFQHIFYLVNFCDELLSDEDRTDVYSRARSRLGESERIFMVSARQALKARLCPDPPCLDASGFQAFEQDLEGFLVANRGALKLRAACRSIEGFLSHLLAAAEAKLSLVEGHAEDRLPELEAQLESRRADIIARKERILRQIGERGVQIAEQLCISLARTCRELSRALPEIARRLELRGGLLERRNYQAQVASHLIEEVRRHLRRWAENDAALTLSSEAERLRQSIDNDLKDVLAAVDDVRLLIQPDFSPQVKITDNTAERVVAAASSLVFGGLSGAVAGGLLGFKGAVTQIGLTFAAQAGLYLLGLLNPVTGVLAAVAVGYGVIRSQMPQVLEAARLEVAEQVRQSVEDLPDRCEPLIREGVFSIMNQLAAAFDSGLSGMLDDLSAQVEAIRRETSANRELAVQRARSAVVTLRSLRQALTDLGGGWNDV